MTWNISEQKNPPMDFTKTLSKEWMLVTAGDPDALGTMTISWGGSGFIWNQNVVFLVIRESRNTLEYLQTHSTFSLAHFDETWHDKLFFCGRNSGRGVDKVSHCGFTPAYDGDEKTPYFEEAKTVFICKKIVDTLLQKEAFKDTLPSEVWETWYNQGVHAGDRHHLIIGSIQKILTR